MRVINPRTGEADYEIAPLNADAVAAEATRLRKAQPDWAAKTPQERGEIMRQWADAIEAALPKMPVEDGMEGMPALPDLPDMSDLPGLGDDDQYTQLPRAEEG